MNNRAENSHQPLRRRERHCCSLIMLLHDLAGLAPIALRQGAHQQFVLGHRFDPAGMERRAQRIGHASL
jgi:hypothetical protein